MTEHRTQLCPFSVCFTIDLSPNGNNPIALEEPFRWITRFTDPYMFSPVMPCCYQVTGSQGHDIRGILRIKWSDKKNAMHRMPDKVMHYWGYCCRIMMPWRCACGKCGYCFCFKAVHWSKFGTRTLYQTLGGPRKSTEVKQGRGLFIPIIPPQWGKPPEAPHGKTAGLNR